MRRVGVVGIVIGDRARSAAQVQRILSQHAGMIVGRMGIPYRERGLAVIALIVDGTTDEVGSLTGKLGNLPGVMVRSALAPVGGAVPEDPGGEGGAGGGNAHELGR